MIDNVLQSTAWINFKNSFDSNRVGHAYILESYFQNQSILFVTKILQLLFCPIKNKPCYLNKTSNELCNVCRLIKNKNHIDSLWLEPSSKSGSILVEDIDQLIERMNKTAFDNIWKAGIILHAEQMHITAQNKLLKTLEEPPSGSIIILVTESSNSLLPTIISRCQKINYFTSLNNNSLEMTEIIELLKLLPFNNRLEALSFVENLYKFISDIPDINNLKNDNNIDYGDLEKLDSRKNTLKKNYQLEVFNKILYWFRDLLILIEDPTNKEIFNYNYRNILMEQSKKIDRLELIDWMSKIQQLPVRFKSNINSHYILRDIFLEMVTN